jgi:hypothetical protein
MAHVPQRWRALARCFVNPSCPYAINTLEALQGSVHAVCPSPGQFGIEDVKRSTAVRLFGGTITTAAKTLKVSRQAIHKWDKEGSMSSAVCDHCLATWLRMAAANHKEMQLVLKLLKLPPDALQLPPPPAPPERAKDVKPETIAA